MSEIQKMVMDQDRIWILMARKFSEEITDDEIRELEQLLKGNAGIHFPLQTLSDLWTSDTYPKDIRKTDKAAELAYAKHLEKLRSAAPIPPEKKKRNLLPYVLTLLIVVTITYLLMPGKPPGTITRRTNEIASTAHNRWTGTLPDGSQVWLNADSKLLYDEGFGSNHRQVTLNGEAYFMVSENQQKPFTIHANAMDITVLGTTFNVKSYPGQQTSEAALISGSLEISLTAGNRQKIDLHPGEKLVVSSQEIPASAAPKAGKSVDEPQFSIQPLTYFNDDQKLNLETSWVNNRLIVQHEKLQNIMATLERRFGLAITFEQEALKQLTVTGVFGDKTLEDALRGMSAMGWFNYHVDGREVIISGKK